MNGVVTLAPMAIEAMVLRWGAPGLEVITTGVGPERSARAASRLRHEEPRGVVVAGLCGALDPHLRPGDVIVPDRLLTPDGRMQELRAAKLRALVAATGARIVEGAILGVDHVVSERERTGLRATGASAVDMESPWLAAAAKGRPFGVVRIVVDAPGYALFRPGILWCGPRALLRLRDVAPAIVAWAARADADPVAMR